MAYRFGEYVIGGHINNTRKHQTFGYLLIAGEERPVPFDLFGDCASDMQGKVISFDAVPPPDPPEKPVDLPNQIIGVTGHISAAGWVRRFDCSVEEYCRRAALGEAPPTRWVRRFYFEFYYQHGRGLIELAAPIVEYNAGDAEHEDWRPLPHDEPMPGPPDKKPDPASYPEIVIVDNDGHVDRVDPREYLDEHGEPQERDPLQRELDRQARAAVRAISGEGDDDIIAEMELMDHCIDHEDGEPLANALYTARNLPAPDEIAEEEIEPLLKGLLGEMAMYGVAIDICEHYSLRDVYRLLYDNMHNEWRFHPELAGTGWVQHYSTWEYCKECEREIEEKYEKQNNQIEAEHELKESGDNAE